jgi:PAS domain S-box-containing protein
MESRRAFRNTILATMRQPAVVLNRQLRIQTANRSFLETFRVSDKETLGQPIFEMADGQWAIPEVHRLLHLLLRDTSGRLQDGSIEHNFKRVGRKSFQISACRLDDSPSDAILLALYEVFPEAKYRHLFDTSRDGILVVDAESAKVTDANRSMADLLGCEGELVGLRFWDIEPLRGTPLGPSGFERVRSQGIVRFPVVRIQTSHRRVVEMDVVGSIVDGTHAVQFNFRDITERRRFDRQPQHQPSQDSLGVLAGGIAHDFNNLLLEIMGNATLALGDAPKESRYRSELNAVIKASQRAADLTEQILAYSGNSTFLLRRIDLSELVSEACTLVESSLPELVALESDLAAHPVFIDADPRLVTQIVTNLVLNGAEAVKVGQAGCIRVVTRQAHADESETIRLHVPAAETSFKRFAVLEVADSGVGMDPATQARIFDPFFSTKFTGRGLGLAAALGIARGHGGTILVDSRTGGGTTFRVFLPLSEFPD